MKDLRDLIGDSAEWLHRANVSLGVGVMGWAGRFQRLQFRFGVLGLGCRGFRVRELTHHPRGPLGRGVWQERGQEETQQHGPPPPPHTPPHPHPHPHPAPASLAGVPLLQGQGADWQEGRARRAGR